MSENTREINNRSRRKIYHRQTIDFHKEYDADCIEWLEGQESRPAAIKRLIREDIARNGKAGS